jgi:hypothetical protein
MSKTMQLALVHETLSDALREVVQALGGSKKVGQLLRPSKAADEGARWVLDCLNADRREHFSPEDVLLLLREGRRVGAHAAMAYLASEAGYAPPVPVEPSDEAAELQRSFIESVKQQQRLLERLGQLGVVALKAVA